jgi:hypothetical protein
MPRGWGNSHGVLERAKGPSVPPDFGDSTNIATRFLACSLDARLPQPTGNFKPFQSTPQASGVRCQSGGPHPKR